jgi:hypothetical protein
MSSGQMLSGQISSRQIYFGANVFLVKCLFGKCCLGKFLYGQMSNRANVIWANVFLGKCRLGKRPSGQTSCGQMSWNHKIYIL